MNSHKQNGKMISMKGKPFLFDSNVFDDDVLTKNQKKDAPPPLEYTINDLEAAKKQAFEEGKKTGFNESQTGLTKQILDLARQINQTAGQFYVQEEERKKIYEQEVVHLTLCVLQKLFPVALEKCGTEEVKKVLSHAIAEQDESREIAIEIHPDELESFESHIKEAGVETGGNIKIIARQDIGIGACRMLWTDGGLIYDTNRLAEKICTILEETLAAQGINRHDAKGIQSGKTVQTNLDHPDTDDSQTETKGKSE